MRVLRGRVFRVQPRRPVLLGRMPQKGPCAHKCGPQAAAAPGGRRSGRAGDVPQVPRMLCRVCAWPRKRQAVALLLAGLPGRVQARLLPRERDPPRPRRRPVNAPHPVGMPTCGAPAPPALPGPGGPTRRQARAAPDALPGRLPRRGAACCRPQVRAQAPCRPGKARRPHLCRDADASRLGRGGQAALALRRVQAWARGTGRGEGAGCRRACRAPGRPAACAPPPSRVRPPEEGGREGVRRPACAGPPLDRGGRPHAAHRRRLRRAMARTPPFHSSVSAIGCRPATL